MFVLLYGVWVLGGFGRFFLASFEEFYLAPWRKTLNSSVFCFSVCSDLEFREVANRLRDWFKALHESGIQNKKTRIVQRPERTSKQFLLVLFGVFYDPFLFFCFSIAKTCLILMCFKQACVQNYNFGLFWSWFPLYGLVLIQDVHFKLSISFGSYIHNALIYECFQIKRNKIKEC